MRMIGILNPARGLAASPEAFSGNNTPTLPGNVDDLSNWCNPWPELIETAEEYVLRMAVHGLQKEDFDIDYSAGRLTVIAHKPVVGRSDVGNRHEGYFNGVFTRTFTLPPMIEAQSIRAEIRDGVLSIHVPKHERDRSAQIKVG